jgi:enoyl-CoA hydratase/carnithine racemase
MKTIRYEMQDGIATVTFDQPNSPVNTMGLQWQEDLSALAAQVVKDQDAIQGIILASAKSTFFAGADLKAVMRLRPSDAPAVFAEIERVKKNFRTLETLGKPVVSCLNGTALGGGWEVALVGHYRIAVDDPKTKFGLPEVTLGLLPGASGVTKMTRHLGLLRAQPYLIEGKTFSPQEAKGLGLVHALIAPSDNAATEMRSQALAWIAANPSVQHPWEARDYKVPGGTPANLKVANMLVLAPAMIRKKTHGLYPAPEAILACMVEGLQVDVPTALRIESRYLAKLMTGSNARAMINTFFFNLNAVKSDPALNRQAANDVFTSRVFAAYVSEGVAMWGEGIPAAVIDNAGLQCGMPAGPWAGLDKTALPANPQVEQRGTPWDITELKDRLLYRQAVETARCLNENALTSVAEANIGSIFEIGFPAWTGGALQFIYSMGIDAFAKRAEQLATRFGAGFVLTDQVKATLQRCQPVY